MVWFWDKDVCTKSIEEQGINVFEILPETILREQSKKDGLTLIPTLDDGYDLQFWLKEIGRAHV